MDNIWKNAARKQRACDLRDATAKLALTAPVHTTDTTTLHQKPITVTTAPSWCDPETVTLEQIDENSRRLQQDWPKEDGIPFPPDMLETLRALRAAVIARDTRRGSSTQADAEAISRKAEKKRRLREKRAAAHTTALPAIVENPSATATIVSNAPTTADSSPIQIRADAAPESCPASALPCVSRDTYDTARPETLYNLLVTAIATPGCDTVDALADRAETVTEPLEPADYSLTDIETALQKIRKRHGRTGTAVPESIQENAELLRRAVRARDTTVPTQITTEPITGFDSDTTAPAPTPTPAPVSTAAQTPVPVPIPTSTPALDSTTTPAPNPSSTTTISPAPANAAPPATCETSERLKRVANAHYVITSPSPILTQPELDSTTATTISNTAIERDSEEPATGRGEERVRRIDVEARESEAERQEREGIEESQEPQRFDWATEIDESIGPVPSVSDFRPATPSQPTRTPSDRIPTSPAPTDCTPTAYTPAAPALIDPDPGDVAPRAHTLATRLLTDNPVPVDPNPAAPTPATCVPTEPQVRTPLIAHGPRDLSALRSGTSNPWGSIKRRRHCLHPLRDLSSLRSGTSNPWSSLRYRNRCSYPLHRHNTHSQPDPVQYSHLYPHHPEKSQPLHNSSSYLHPLPPQLNSRSQTHLQTQHQLPVHIFQIIQHPHGISPTKPKITKIIPTTTAKIPKNTRTPCCACGNIIPRYRPDCESWRSMDTRDSRFRRRSRRFWIANEGVRYLGGGALVIVSSAHSTYGRDTATGAFGLD